MDLYPVHDDISFCYFGFYEKTRGFSVFEYVVFGAVLSPPYFPFFKEKKYFQHATLLLCATLDGALHNYTIYDKLVFQMEPKQGTFKKRRLLPEWRGGSFFYSLREIATNLYAFHTENIRPPKKRRFFVLKEVPSFAIRGFEQR